MRVRTVGSRRGGITSGRLQVARMRDFYGISCFRLTSDTLLNLHAGCVDAVGLFCMTVCVTGLAE
jgi:hypothetical protein